MISLPRILAAVGLLAFSCAVSAQTPKLDPAPTAETILRKRDLLTVIAEAEKSEKSDLQSLFLRLDLYSRAANGPKMSVTLDQIIAAAESFEKPAGILSRATPYAKDTLVTDSHVIFRFLRSEFDGDLFSRLITLCTANAAACDPNSIDNWLARKASDQPESDTDIHSDHNGRWAWTDRWIYWRKRLGMDISGITAQFADAVRNDPTNLNAALRFVRYAENAQELRWLADTFSSKRAYDYFELGSRLARLSEGVCCPQFSSREDRVSVNLEGSKLLRRSLEISFTENDIRLMETYRLSRASVPPRIGNYEKQLRYWTKKELADVYLKVGMAQDAQPLVEELTNTDKSDILADSAFQLAGAAQMASGARVVESKILAEQAAKQDTYKYWLERIEYYRGRKEPVPVFDSYLQALKVVPADPSERYSGEERLRLIRNFAEFATDPDFGMGGVEFSNIDELRERFEKETKVFLADEFERTKKQPRYAYELLDIVQQEDFDELSDKLLPEYPRVILGAYRIPSTYILDDVVRHYLETADESRKEALLTSLVKMAAKLDARTAWSLCEMLVGLEQTSHIPRLIPILMKNHLATKSIAYNDDYLLNKISQGYREILFDVYIRINDWRSGEKLFNGNRGRSLSSPYVRLALAAARSGSTDDAMRFWKVAANLNRRDLDYLSSYRSYPTFSGRLRAFYREMKTNEPYSPVPDLALAALK